MRPAPIPPQVGSSVYEVAQKLKDDPGARNIPIIFLSAKGTAIDQEYGLKKGAGAYIPKPFEPKHLMDTVEELLIANPPQKRTRPSYEQILIDESKEKKVSWKG